MDKQNNRKNEHVSLSEHFYNSGNSSLEDIHFVHHSFPRMDVSDVSLETQVGELSFNVPFYINAMSGGSKWTGKVNKKLATIAKEAGLAIATGSVSAAIKNPEVADSFKIVRSVNKDGLVFANLGANHGLEDAKKTIDLLDADAMQIHLNSPQEIVMPEGDRTFRDWEKNIEEIISNIDLPVIVKEVGFGMSRETVQFLEGLGVKYIDISGSGGTNFAQIENFRRKSYKLDDIELWGQTTAVSILEAMEVNQDAHIIASGGIRKPIDIVKSLALGAEISGLSSQFMHMALDDVDGAIETIENWKEELKKIFTLLGAEKPSDLTKSSLVITGETAEWAKARKIDIQKYASR